ncbi:MAG: GNAT family N-acetyltransferase [Candidatus Poseidoniaceae archaeon]|nr:GNAT family N-acetyltransferase [Candidatus Poseidoniaceae archaeon]
MILRPVSRRILPEVMEAFNEDPEAARSALPWLKEGDEARSQIADLMIDLELHKGGDKIHFWAIHSLADNSFVGMIGLGDELQLAASAYNLGYWVRKNWRMKGVAGKSVNAIFSWLETYKQQALIEITVHPHNEAGLAVCKSICNNWNGLAVEGYVGIECNGRTVPHILHLVQLNRGD